MSTTKQRPPQVTMAAGMVIGGSIFVVLSVVEQLGSLRSLESREGIESFLSQPPGSGMGLDVEGVISLLYITSMVAAGCATAAAILGWHVLKRDLKARIALTVIAVPLFVSGLVTGGFISSLVAASVVVLWMPPAREWFRFGTWTPPTPREKRSSVTRSAGGSAGSSDPNPWGRPDHPHDPSAQVPGARAPGAQAPDPQGSEPQGSGPQGPPPQATPYGMAHAGSHQLQRPVGAPSATRPKPLVLAVLLTMVFAVLTALMAGLSAAAVLVAPDMVMEELNRQRPDLAEQGITPALLRATTLALGAFVVVWAIVAVVLASLAFSGRDWARVALMASAIGTAVACLVMAFGAPLLLVPGAAAVATVLNLRKPEVRAWCARSRGHQGAARDGMWP